MDTIIHPIHPAIQKVINLNLIETGGQFGIISKSKNLEHLPSHRIEKIYDKVQLNPCNLFSEDNINTSNLKLFILLAELLIQGHQTLKCVCDCIVEVPNPLNCKEYGEYNEKSWLFRLVDVYFPKLNVCIITGGNKYGRFKSVQQIIPIIIPISSEKINNIDSKVLLDIIEDYIKIKINHNDYHPYIKEALARDKVTFGFNHKVLSKYPDGVGSLDEELIKKRKKMVKERYENSIIDYRINTRRTAQTVSKLCTIIAKLALDEDRHPLGLRVLKEKPIFYATVRTGNGNKLQSSHVTIGNLMIFAVDIYFMNNVLRMPRYDVTRIQEFERLGYKVVWKTFVDIYSMSINEGIEWIKKELSSL